MSYDNDDIWKVLAGEAKTYRHKTGLTKEALERQKSSFRQPNRRVVNQVQWRQHDPSWAYCGRWSTPGPV